MPDFTKDLADAGIGQEMAKVQPELQRIATDSDKDASPMKNAADINVLAMALSLAITGIAQMAQEHATMKAQIDAIAGTSAPTDNTQTAPSMGNQDMGGNMGGGNTAE
jgi:hypothetical protein